jgi:hypothetical protein
MRRPRHKWLCTAPLGALAGERGDTPGDPASLPVQPRDGACHCGVLALDVMSPLDGVNGTK